MQFLGKIPLQWSHRHITARVNCRYYMQSFCNETTNNSCLVNHKSHISFFHTSCQTRKQRGEDDFPDDSSRGYYGFDPGLHKNVYQNELQRLHDRRRHREDDKKLSKGVRGYWYENIERRYEGSGELEKTTEKFRTDKRGVDKPTSVRDYFYIKRDHEVANSGYATLKATVRTEIQIQHAVQTHARKKAKSIVDELVRKKETPSANQEHYEHEVSKTKSLAYEHPTSPGEKKYVSCPLPDKYSPAYVESSWYEWWEKQDYFKPRSDVSDEDQFVICLPPPNVTGSLHIGHALGCSIQDALVRWHRMSGRKALWIPGSDHAGIATQVVVEKDLWREEKKTRHDIGRDAFIRRAWKWKEEKGSRIYDQMRRLGCSLDWSREKFTLDPSMTRAVNEAFIRLYNQGLIYRSSRLVNWSCALQSTISDIEVDKLQIDKKTYLSVPGYEKKVAFGMITNFAYPLSDSDEELIVSTTRIETMLGDVAVAVHPDDSRYTCYHGRHVRHPFSQELIPIITDEMVEIGFGTGVVKITPGHDQNDFDVGVRHGLPLQNILSESGCMVNVPQPFTGMPRFEARAAVLKALKQHGMLRESRNHAMALPVCSRSGDVIEPLLKDQWHVDVTKMSECAREAVKDGNVKLIPESHEKVWENWLRESRPWCVSRQLWWGHQVPAYWAEHTSTGQGSWIVAHSYAEALSEASSVLQCHQDELHIKQDEDVLDTWFSSGLFPFACLGWPDKSSSDLNSFYPTSLLETAGDILFFWVARMVMLGPVLTGKLPFHTVLMHALLRDAHGRKMSKSLGNVIDPMDVIYGTTLKKLQDKLQDSNLPDKELKKASEGLKKDFPAGITECGADALRFSLCSYQTQAHELNVNPIHIRSHRNFCQKIWQAFRFCSPEWHLNGYPDITSTQFSVILNGCSATDLWILSRLSALVSTCNTSFKEYNLNTACLALDNFWRGDFCDVYIEYSKATYNDSRDTEECLQRKQCVSNITYHCISTALRCLSPFMPYLTEELYQRLPGRVYDSVMIAQYPQTIDYRWSSPSLDNGMNEVRSVITKTLAVRQILNNEGISVQRTILKADHSDMAALLQSHADVLKRLARCEAGRMGTDWPEFSCDVGSGCRAYMQTSHAGSIDQVQAMLEEKLMQKQQKAEGDKRTKNI